MKRNETIRLTGLTQADSGVEIDGVGLSDHFLFTVVPSESATGVLEFEIKTDSESDYEFLYSSTINKQTVDLSDGVQTFVLTGYFADSFKITSEGVTNSYDFILQQSSQ